MNEIFYSIQGESTFAGLPCTFIRTTGCNLNCNYCDTEYAKHEGRAMSADEIIENISKYNCNLVEITGGEPLLQKNIYELVEKLRALNYKILIETNGSQNISQLPQEVIKVIDWKTPGSAEGNSFDLGNIDNITQNDEIKFVISNKEDFDWCVEKIQEHKLSDKCKVLMSVVNGNVEPAALCQWIIEENLTVRFQLQLHKYIWPNDEKGR